MTIQQEVYQIIHIIKIIIIIIIPQQLLYLTNAIPVTISQQINFIRKLEEESGVTMFFVAEKQQETV